LFKIGIDAKKVQAIPTIITEEDQEEKNFFVLRLEGIDIGKQEERRGSLV